MDEITKQFDGLKLAEKSCIQLESVDEEEDQDYVLDIAIQPGENPLIGAACSTHDIRLLTRSRLTTVGTLEGHDETVTGLTFGKEDPNILYSSSTDKTIRCWDVRTGKEAQVITVPSNSVHMVSNKDPGPPLCVDISPSDRLLCAGTEKSGNDAFVLFWDRRQCKLLGAYAECHQDDVTQVRFQPDNDNNLATGSVDGLLCTLDLFQTNEDDALQITSNAESAISKLGWCGEDNKCVYCITSDNKVFSWDGFEGDDCFSIDVMNDLLKQYTYIEYVVDCVPEYTACGADRSSSILIAGSNKGLLHVISHNAKNTSVVSTLSRGHNELIRCAHWDGKTNTLLSGGEDSLLCLWSADGDFLDAASTTSKSKKAKKSQVKSFGAPSERKPYKRKDLY